MLAVELTKKILGSIANFYMDNHDYYRYGKAKYDKSLTSKLKYALVKRVNRLGLTYWKKNNPIEVKKYDELSGYFERLQSVYESFNDEPSKLLLVDLLAYYILGKHRIKLPLNTQRYWDTLHDLEKQADKGDTVLVENWNQKLWLFDLNRLGYSIKLYFTPKGVLNDFILKQYEYMVSSSRTIKAERGDYVIDAGGCYGDTALYFAEMVGAKGKVFVFEFIPSNIKVAERNFDLNKSISESIQLVKNPVWEMPGIPVYYIDKGPGSKVTFDQTENGQKVLTESIDNLVTRLGIPKVNFIKMDIEGAEMPALKGAIETIRRFKPRLAISVYHSISDLCEVPKFIRDIDPSYKLYLGHYTIHKEETVLFAELI